MRDIWFNLQDHERYAYHYTRADTLANFILSSRQLRLSRFERLNDPRESKDWSFTFDDYSDDLDASVAAITSAYNRQLRLTWRLGCFTMDDVEASIRHPAFNPIHALWYRGHSRPRMWAQYGDNYAGACLVLDRAALDKAVKAAVGPAATVHSGKVKYEIDPFAGNPLAANNPHKINCNSVRMMGADNAAATHVKAHYELLYFRKAPDWAAEKEFRWAVSSAADKEFYLDIRDCLLGMALGDKFDKNLKPLVGQYAMDHGTEVANMEWRNNGVPQPVPTHPRILIDLPTGKRSFRHRTVVRLRKVACRLCGKLVEHEERLNRN